MLPKDPIKRAETLLKLSNAAKIRCKDPEWIRKQSESHKGKPSANKGKPMSEEQKNKLRLAGMGKKQSQETKDKRSASLKGKYIGELNGMFGKHLTEEHKQILIDVNTGKIVSEETRKKIGIKHKGKIVSEETRKKLSDNLKGKYMRELSPCWKGGSTLQRDIRRLWQMKEWVYKVFERDEYKDVITGLRSRNLNAHHIIPFSELLITYNIKTIEDAINCKELWDINNGITLDRDNHMKLFHSSSNLNISKSNI